MSDELITCNTFYAMYNYFPSNKFLRFVNWWNDGILKYGGERFPKVLTYTGWVEQYNSYCTWG